MQDHALILPQLLLLWLFQLLPFPAEAQSLSTPPETVREKTLLAGDWKFDAHTPASHVEKSGFSDQAWQTVSIPHTWNSKTNAQTHKAAWYRTHFSLPETDRGKEIFLYFEGAATVADVYLNGTRLGQHRGAYTRFIFDGTASAVFGGDNVLAVKCDTDPKDTADCLPAGDGYQLYHVYGGLYRKVWLLKTAPVHIDPMDDAASGVFLIPQNITPEEATLAIKTLVRNDGTSSQTVTVTNTVCDDNGHLVATGSVTIFLAAQTHSATVVRTVIPRPHLWSHESPALYHVYTETDVGGKATDFVAERTGLRTYRMTPDTFSWNGVTTPLRGVAKHQETEERASAVRDEDLIRDWNDLQELGVNYVRLAHYPHAALEYDLADERGIVVWAENGHSNPAGPTATGDRITREMIRQNYNHPSICFWSVGNEAIVKKSDIATLEHYAKIVRAEDSTRLVTYASNTTFSQSHALDFVAVNRYLGWYGGLISSFAAHAKYYHYISETGAGGVISTHTTARLPIHIVNDYEPEEYQQEVAESRCQTVFRDDADEVPLFTWWTFRDFGDPRYKGLNTKGLETYAGFHKDSYYLFQSFLRPETPVVHLCAKSWFLRRRQFPTDGFALKAYSNADALSLTLNGRAVGTAQNGEYTLPNKTAAANVFSWNAPVRSGRNEATVDDGKGHTDSAVFYCEEGDAGLVRNLVSSNPDNPAYFINLPIQPEQPFYDDFNGDGDNTFHEIPALLEGARWITMSRPSRPLTQTSLIFTLAPESGAIDVFLMFTASPAPAARFLDGFADTGVTGTWRDNAENLVPYALYRRTAQGGQTIRLPGAAHDYLVLLKPHPPAPQN